MKLVRIFVAGLCMLVIPWSGVSTQEPDQSKLKQNWDAIQRLWVDIREFNASQEGTKNVIPFVGDAEIPDKKFGLYARLVRVFEAAGAFGKEPPAVSRAIKDLFKILINPPPDHRKGGAKMLMIPAKRGEPSPGSDPYTKGFGELRKTFTLLEEGDQKGAKAHLKKGLELMGIMEGLSERQQEEVVNLVLELASAKPSKEKDMDQHQPGKKIKDNWGQVENPLERCL
jgi:hypothetical protein